MTAVRLLQAHIKSDPKSRVGTLAYMAPEIASNRPGQRYDGRAADIWSAGVLLFTMITGAPKTHTVAPFALHARRQESLPNNNV